MITSENEFEGKVALITGATSGIGRAVAIELAGANVVATGRRVEQGAALEPETGSLPGEIKFVQADVMIADDVKRIVDVAVDSFGGLDLAFNNAGASRKLISDETGNPARLHEYTDEHWDYYSDMFFKEHVAVHESRDRGHAPCREGRHYQQRFNSRTPWIPQPGLYSDETRSYGADQVGGPPVRG